MDYGDEFPSAPVRYTFDDSDDELDPDLPTSDKLTLTLSHELPDQPVKLIIGLHAGRSYLNAVEGTHIGTIEKKDPNKKASEVANIVLCNNSIYLAVPHVDATLANEYARVVLDAFGARLQQVILLDSYINSEYTSKEWGVQDEPPFIRLLQTSSTKKISGILPYESPNLVKDLAAAIIAKCEIHGIPCYALFSLQESLLGKHIVTADTCTAYATALENLGFQLSLDENKLYDILTKGGVDEHHHRLYL
ncbi:hypothetical protein DM01DRAFT_1336056 [Hesseltinella vesiculosa]|uniref:Proteasome assembly chaperone 1 n=1 Tax=Hesseltinella vesiculosa TaxID=101127 RepID=A0A1X2GGY4_9FUNG|nr:hypothetical protein DM01DRAFT_1336056 [Hesseltinella vesiculosa]